MSIPNLFSHKSLIAIFIIAVSVLFAFGIISNVLAQDPLDNITFPIAELGNCENEDSCKLYCDSLDHIDECLDFAEEHHLLEQDEIEEARHFADAGGVGPGGCTGKDSCDAFCENIDHMEECLLFGEEHGLIPPEELEEARKVADALRGGAELPGGCNSKDSCDVYCENPDHIDECLLFAEKAGLIPPEELEEAKKFAAFMKRGETPGGCRGHLECELYCEDGAHFDECVAFAVKAGVIPPEELELIKKTGGKGPGGCRGRDECEEFCNLPGNQEQCFSFAKEHGLIPEGELAHIEEGLAHLREGINNAPPEVVRCLEDSIGDDIYERILSGDFTPNQRTGEVMRHCFESFGPEPSQIIEILSQAPPGVFECIEGRLGRDVIQGVFDGDLSVLNPDAGEIIKHCFEEFGEFSRDDDRGQFDDDRNEFGGDEDRRDFFEEFGGFEGEDGGRFDRDRGEFRENEDHEEFFEEFRGKPDFERSHNDSGASFDQLQFPLESLDCLAEQFGDDFREKVFRGELSFNEIESQVRVCVEQGIRNNFEPPNTGGFPPEEEFGFEGGFPPSQPSYGGKFGEEDLPPYDGNFGGETPPSYGGKFEGGVSPSYEGEFDNFDENVFEEEFEGAGFFEEFDDFEKELHEIEQLEAREGSPLSARYFFATVLLSFFELNK